MHAEAPPQTDQPPCVGRGEACRHLPPPDGRHPKRSFGRWELILLLAVVAAGCAPAADLKKDIQVTDVTTGWFDAGTVNGKNKLVPSVTFRLRKPTEIDLEYLSLNLVFKRDGETDGEDIYVRRVDFIDASQTAPVTVRTEAGYTADPPQTRAEMLKNSQFRDMDVQIFAKQSSSQWVELQRTKIVRQVLTQ